LFAIFPNATAVELVNSGTDVDVASMATMPLLERIEIRDGRVVGHTLSCLSPSLKLEVISLYNCPIDRLGIDEGIRLACSRNIFLSIDSNVESLSIENVPSRCVGALSIETPAWSLSRFEGETFVESK
jgi:hypothetical protein